MTKATPTMDDADLHALSDLSIYNCLRFGSYRAVIYEDQGEVREYSNMDIAREAAQLAMGLQRLGIQKGDRVMMMMSNCPEVLIAYQAIPRVGGIIIPVLPLLKPLEVRYIAENSAAKVVITSSVLLPLLHGALADVPTMEHIISTGEIGEYAASTTSHLLVHAYGAVVASGRGDDAERGALEGDTVPLHTLAEGETVHVPLPAFLSTKKDVPVNLDDTAVILYTSGTTGRPKGVVLSHGNLLANALSSRGEALDRRDAETYLAVLPLAHAYGIITANVFFLRGLTMVMHSRFDTTAVFSAIERYGVAYFAGVPTMFVVLFYSPDGDEFDTSSLKSCLCGSAPLPVAILQGFEEKFGCQILEGYGLSEASAALTGHVPDMLRKPGSVGKPIPGVEVLVVDEKDESVSVGEVGEVIARGPNIMRGYYNMPEETAAALRNGWLYTGDMGRFDEDGYLYIVERKKDLIIRGGLNVYPRDVEEVLNMHPAVMEAAVVGVPSEWMGEEVKAFVVTRSAVDAETLMAYCRESLANYKSPSVIEFVRSLPRNLMGKVDKKELRSRG